MKENMGQIRIEKSLVPGVSAYDDSQDVDMDVGTTPEQVSSVSFSTTAAFNPMVSPVLDDDAESEESVHSVS